MSTDREKNKILGCPKCGGIAVLQSGIAASAIHCSNACGADDTWHNSKQEAVATWNARKE